MLITGLKIIVSYGLFKGLDYIFPYIKNIDKKYIAISGIGFLIIRKIIKKWRVLYIPIVILKQEDKPISLYVDIYNNNIQQVGQLHDYVSDLYRNDFVGYSNREYIILESDQYPSDYKNFKDSGYMDQCITKKGEFVYPNDKYIFICNGLVVDNNLQKNKEYNIKNSKQFYDQGIKILNKL